MRALVQVSSYFLSLLKASCKAVSGPWVQGDEVAEVTRQVTCTQTNLLNKSNSVKCWLVLTNKYVFWHRYHTQRQGAAEDIRWLYKETHPMPAAAQSSHQNSEYLVAAY